MRRGRGLGWCLLVVWCAWLFALQGLFASSTLLGPWTPDLGIVLLLALDPRLDRSDALTAIAVVAGSRIAFTSDPPLAVLVGYATLVFLVRRLRRGLEVDRALPRAFVAAVAAAVLTAYWTLCRGVALAADGLPTAPGDAGASTRALLAAAGATALAAVFLGPLLVRLPGMSPLRRRR
jgi:hypothetical protein